MESGQTAPIRKVEMLPLSLLPTPLRVHQNFKVCNYTIYSQMVKHADDVPTKFHICTFKEDGVRENLTWFAEVYRTDSKPLSF